MTGSRSKPPGDADSEQGFEESDRLVELADPLARAITTLRRDGGVPPNEASGVSVCFWTLRKVEGELGCTIPDAVIAYVLGGLSRRAKKLADLPGLTAEAYGHARDSWDGPRKGMKHVCFDVDGFGNPLCFSRGSDAGSDGVVLLDHEEGMRPTREQPLLERLEDRAEFDESLPPFEVRVQFITAPSAQSIPDTVTHPKFGDGVIQKRVCGPKGDKLTIVFDDGETRVLLERFVDYVEK